MTGGLYGMGSNAIREKDLDPRLQPKSTWLSSRGVVQKWLFFSSNPTICQANSFGIYENILRCSRCSISQQLQESDTAVRIARGQGSSDHVFFFPSHASHTSIREGRRYNHIGFVLPSDPSMQWESASGQFSWFGESFALVKQS